MGQIIKDEGTTTLIYGANEGFFTDPFSTPAETMAGWTADAMGFYNPEKTPEYRSWDYSEALEYTKIFPELKGQDKVWSVCWECAGSGLYRSPTQHRDHLARPYCFRCEGRGGRYIKVESARDSVREKAKKNLKAHLAEIEWENGREAREAEARRKEEEQEAQRIKEEIESKETIAAVSEDYPIGHKLDGVQATIARIAEFTSESPWSYDGPELTRVVTFMDDSGLQFSWFSTSGPIWEMEVGDKGKLFGTVKDLGTFRGQAQVTISRARFKDVVKLPKENN